MSESPPPTVTQLYQLLLDLSQTMLESGEYPDEMVYKLGVAAGLCAHLIATYPELTRPLGGDPDGFE